MMIDGCACLYKGFMDCTNLKTIVLPKGLIKLWDDIFSGCTSIGGEITIPATTITNTNDSSTGNDDSNNSKEFQESDETTTTTGIKLNMILV
mmetsp:Transcript_19065/g.19350  ORF Transcript_19065/g.19350 Transcript_19065/m.19350 type:complete len:92 (-) Transcript_19065:136-411(-)